MVKISLRPLSEQEFVDILNGQYNALLKGGTLADIDVFRVSKLPMRGSGFMDIMSSIGKFFLPAVRKILAPAATNFACGLVDNISQGKNFKSSLKTRGLEGLKRIGTRILSGKGKRTSPRNLVGSGARRRPHRANLLEVVRERGGPHLRRRGEEEEEEGGIEGERYCGSTYT